MDATATHDNGTTPTAPHAVRDVNNGDSNGDRLPKTNSIAPHAEVEIGNGATSPVPDPGTALSSPAAKRPRCGAGGYQGGLLRSHSFDQGRPFFFHQLFISPLRTFYFFTRSATELRSIFRVAYCVHALSLQRSSFCLVLLPLYISPF